MNGGSLNRRGLTIKQALFVKHYIRTNGNGVKAAQLAGYDSDYYALASIASENLNKPKVQNELQRTMSKVLSKDEVLSGLTEVANSEPEIKGSDKMKALELIGKWHKLFTDRVETSNSDSETKSQIISEVAQRFGLSEERATAMVSEVYGESEAGQPSPSMSEVSSDAVS